MLKISAISLKLTHRQTETMIYRRDYPSLKNLNITCQNFGQIFKKLLSLRSTKTECLNSAFSFWLYTFWNLAKKNVFVWPLLFTLCIQYTSRLYLKLQFSLVVIIYNIKFSQKNNVFSGHPIHIGNQRTYFLLSVWCIIAIASTKSSCWIETSQKVIFIAVTAYTQYWSQHCT